MSIVAMQGRERATQLLGPGATLGRGFLMHRQSTARTRDGIFNACGLGLGYWCLGKKAARLVDSFTSSNTTSRAAAI